MRAWKKSIGAEFTPLLVLLAWAILLISGCAGSKTLIIPMELHTHEMDTVSLMPFNTTFERKYYSDVHMRAPSFLIGAITREINRRSGIYTYTFEDKDLMNLRASIVQSLSRAGHYSEVNDIISLEDQPIEKGLLLYIDFKKMGVSQKIAFICEIEATIRITDASGNTLARKEVLVQGKGIMTLGAGKNQAIERFLEQIASLLNQV